MALPGYAAELSLYRTSRSYRTLSGGLAGVAGPTVLAQQTECQSSCASDANVCRTLCIIFASFFTGLCINACNAAYDDCLNDCSSGGGGSPPECGQGRRCCERDENGRCRICIPANAQCP